MAVTRLERKGRRNKSRAKNRVNSIKRLSAVPTIKNVDIEEIKKSFEKAPAKKAPAKKAAAEKAEEAPAKEDKAEVKAPAKEEKAEAKTKAAPKAEKKAETAKGEE